MLDTSELLEKFIEDNKSVRNVFLSSSDGFVIDGAVSSLKTDLDSLCAEIMPKISDMINISDELKFGKLDTAMLEYQKGLLLVSIIDEDIILVILAKGVNTLGSLRIKVKKLIKELKDSL